MNLPQGLILDPEDCFICRNYFAFLTVPLVLLAALGAAIAV